MSWYNRPMKSNMLLNKNYLKRKLKQETQEAKGFIQEFREFVVKGNVMDLAVGIIIGAAFTSVVDSLVNDVIMPPIASVTGRVDLSNLYFTLNGQAFASLAEATAAGAPIIKYGLFLNALINFLIVGLVIFLVVKQLNRLKREEENKDKEETPEQPFCPFCFEPVHVDATRCPHCTSELKGA